MRLITVHVPDLQVEDMAEMVRLGKFANRSVLIREALAAFLVDEKADIRRRAITMNIDDEIDTLFYQGYFEEFLEELEEKEPVLFKQYSEHIEKKSKSSKPQGAEVQ